MGWNDELSVFNLGRCRAQDEMENCDEGWRSVAESPDPTGFKVGQARAETFEHPMSATIPPPGSDFAIDPDLVRKCVGGSY